MGSRWYSLPDVLDSDLTTRERKEEIRAMLTAERDSRTLKCAANAWHFLTTGESKDPVMHGSEWNRDYNPWPYSGSGDKPKDVDMYIGTGIGCLYNLEGTRNHLWQLAGWNIVRTGAEVRKRRK